MQAKFFFSFWIGHTILVEREEGRGARGEERRGDRERGGIGRECVPASISCGCDARLRNATFSNCNARKFGKFKK